MDTKQFIKYSLLYGKSSSVTGSFWKRYTVRHIFPCLSMITTANSSILMITVFIKIDIKSILYKKWRRSLTPIISCNGRRNGSRKSILYPCCPCYSQILLCRQRVFILHHHNQVFHHRIAYNSCINHTEIGIKEQFGFRKCIKILRHNIVNTMVQPFLTLNDRHFLVTSGNGRCPKNIISLRRFIVKQFRCPAIMCSRLMHHYRNRTLLTPMD